MKKIIYVCSPLRGDVKNNIKRANEYSKFVYQQGYIPVAPHVTFTQFLNDDIPEERKDGMDMGLELLRVCDEVWVFGEILTEGMAREAELAERLGRPIHRIQLPLTVSKYLH